MTDRSGRRRPGILVRAWLKVHQPRVISVLYFAIYAVAAAGGVTALTSPPRSIEGVVGEVAMTTLALLLILGGTLGAPSALLGAWWLERLAVVSIAFSVGIYGLIVTILEIQESGNRKLQLSIILIVLLMQGVRWHRIRHRPYDPSRHV